MYQDLQGRTYSGIFRTTFTLWRKFHRGGIFLVASSTKLPLRVMREGWSIDQKLTYFLVISTYGFHSKWNFAWNFVGLVPRKIPPPTALPPTKIPPCTYPYRQSVELDLCFSSTSQHTLWPPCDDDILVQMALFSFVSCVIYSQMDHTWGLHW